MAWVRNPLFSPNGDTTPPAVESVSTGLDSGATQAGSLNVKGLVNLTIARQSSAVLY
jgi:hypothetical protein